MYRDQVVAEHLLPRNIMFGVSTTAIAPAYPAKASTRPRLLWVDDSEMLLLIYKAVFESLGFEVVTSASPERALDDLSSTAADVAILDFDMPEMNGGELAAAIKDRLPMLPVILYTGSSRIPHAASCCVDAVCTKAAPREELLTTIERLLRESQPRELGGFASFLERTAAQQA